MFKAVCMFRLKKGINTKVFEEYFKKHVAEAKELKNLKKYTISKIINQEDEKHFYRINELYYSNMKELEESFTSKLAETATEDLMKWVDDFKCIIVEEEEVI